MEWARSKCNIPTGRCTRAGLVSRRYITTSVSQRWLGWLWRLARPCHGSRTLSEHENVNSIFSLSRTHVKDQFISRPHQRFLSRRHDVLLTFFATPLRPFSRFTKMPCFIAHQFGSIGHSGLIEDARWRERERDEHQNYPLCVLLGCVHILSCTFLRILRSKSTAPFWWYMRNN